MIARLSISTAISAAIAALGYRARVLSGDGALTATGVGAAILSTTGWRGGVLLGGFFVSSSALSYAVDTSEMAAKGSRRDALQVLANGGVAAVGALLGRSAGERYAFRVVAGSLAAATADTWATELGAASRKAPRLVLSGRCVAPGTSGGVTARGTLGTVAGAVSLAALAGVMTSGRAPLSRAGVAVAGVAGSLIDSVVGELIQERRYCPACRKPTEARVHRCGTPTLHLGGLAGVDNDIVNLICTLAGALVAMLALDDESAGGAAS